MNDLIEFLEAVSLKNSEEVKNLLGCSLDNMDNLSQALANASPHLESALEGVLKSGMLHLMG